MLTELGCKNFKPKDKAYKKFDGGGLFLFIKSNGRKYWHLKYRIAGKEKLLALGVYPEVSLSDARSKRSMYREKIKEGIDPIQEKRQVRSTLKQKQDNTFEKVALEWLEKWSHGREGREASIRLSRLKRHIFSYLGNIPIQDITTEDLISVVKRIEGKGTLAEAEKTRGIVNLIFKYAVATSRIKHNIMADTVGAYKVAVVKHFPCFNEKEFGEFLKNFDSFRGNPLTKLALKLLILTFLRSESIRLARWEEFDFEKSIWRVPAEHMKMKRLHIVPLSKQALTVLDEIKKIRGGNAAGLLFPSYTDPLKPISDNTLSKALRDQGYQGKATPHGMRATASTILNEKGFRSDVIEIQLAHCEQNKVRDSYNHAQYLQERREMMDWWGDFVGKLEGK